MLNEKKFILSLVHHVPGKNPTMYARRVPPISNALRDTILEISLPKEAVDCQKGMYFVLLIKTSMEQEGRGQRKKIKNRLYTQENLRWWDNAH